MLDLQLLDKAKKAKEDNGQEEISRMKKATNIRGREEKKKLREMGMEGNRKLELKLCHVILT